MTASSKIATDRGMAVELKSHPSKPSLQDGGGGGIRTHGGFNTSSVFKTDAIDHSATPPFDVFSSNRSRTR